jgi:hypothetical protein
VAVAQHKWSSDVPAVDEKYISDPGPNVYLTEDEYRALRHPNENKEDIL